MSGQRMEYYLELLLALKSTQLLKSVMDSTLEISFDYMTELLKKRLLALKSIQLMESVIDSTMGVWFDYMTELLTEGLME